MSGDLGVWQPIETAPLDGTVVLIESSFRVGESSYGVCLRQDDGYVANGGRPCWRAEDQRKMFPGDVVRWMPMPQPLKAAGISGSLNESPDPPKDLCITCGREVADEIWGGKCERGHVTVHQEKCQGCSRIIGLVIDDDNHGADLLYCPDCMDGFRKKLKQSST